MSRDRALQKLKSLLYVNDKVQDLEFAVVWESFEVGVSEYMGDGIELTEIEKGTNKDGCRYVSFIGKMPKGSVFPKNQHSDASEGFMCLKGLIKETVSSVLMESGRMLNFRPRAHHGFKALRASEFFCVLTETTKK